MRNDFEVKNMNWYCGKCHVELNVDPFTWKKSYKNMTLAHTACKCH